MFVLTLSPNDVPSPMAGSEAGPSYWTTAAAGEISILLTISVY